MADREIVIMGPPGAGKGTQSERIASSFDVDHVTTGGVLRENKDMETEYGSPREYMEAGELVPDSVVNEIVSKALAEIDADDDLAGYVLDGYPRTISQAEYLDTIATIDVVLYLEVSRETLVERLTGRRTCEDCGRNYHVDFDPPAEAGVCDDCGGDVVQREDDREEVVTTRIEEYERKTAPVVEHYDEEGLLVNVDGENSPDEVWATVRETVTAEV
ncbi:adenylate kinase [Halobacteriales archaeon SW_7_71_33]|nr:MAG: adenylate kinase [Halobacteriales archaeon SW_7_71_33]